MLAMADGHRARHSVPLPIDMARRLATSSRNGNTTSRNAVVWSRWREWPPPGMRTARALGRAPAKRSASAGTTMPPASRIAVDDQGRGSDHGEGGDAVRAGLPQVVIAKLGEDRGVGGGDALGPAPAILLRPGGVLPAVVGGGLVHTQAGERDPTGEELCHVRRRAQRRLLQHDRGRPVGVLGRPVQTHHAAERVTEQERALDPEVVEEPVEIRGVVGEQVARRGFGGVAVAAQVGDDRAVAVGEGSRRPGGRRPRGSRCRGAGPRSVPGRPPPRPTARCRSRERAARDDVLCRRDPPSPLSGRSIGPAELWPGRRRAAARRSARSGAFPDTSGRRIAVESAR